MPDAAEPADRRMAREDAIRRLVDAGAGMVLCGGASGKASIQSQGRGGAPVRPDADAVIAHMRAPVRSGQAHNVGVLLETLGLAVVDFDGAPHDQQDRWARTLAHAAPPLVIMRSLSGGYHCYYRLARKRRKARVKFALPRWDGIRGKEGADVAKPDRDVTGEVLYPWGAYAVLPGDNVIALARAVLDTADDHGRWDTELGSLLVPRAPGNVPQLLYDLRHAGTGERNDTLYGGVRAAAPIRDNGVIVRAFAAVASVCGLTDSETRATIASARAGKARTLPKPITPTASTPDADADDQGPWQVDAGVSASGLREALGKLGVRIGRLVDHGNAVGVRWRGSDDWAVADKDDTDRLQGLLRTHFRVAKVVKGEVEWRPMAASVQAWAELYQVVADDHRVDVMGDFLARCPVTADADAAYRELQEFPFALWDIADECADIARVAFPALLIGAVARYYQPGAKLDAMTILSSRPGLGKSTFVRALLPPDARYEAKVAMGLTLAGIGVTGDKEACVVLSGRVFAEVEEMTARGVSVDALKGFVSRTTDTYRDPYGRKAYPHPRSTVLIGTTNNPDPLPSDPEGHRKFWLVRLDGMAPECEPDADTADFVRDYMRAHRERLFGAAIACWRAHAGEARAGTHPQLVMPRALWQAVTDLAADASATAPVEQEIVDRVSSVPDGIAYLTGQEIVEMIGRARVVDGEYQPAPNALLKAVSHGMRACRPRWTRRPLRVIVNGVGERRLRVYTRAGSALDEGVVFDRDARRQLLGISDPADRGNGFAGRRSGDDHADGAPDIRDVDDIPF